MKRAWTDSDLDDMSWHDNAVHALRIVEGKSGIGELVLHVTSSNGSHPKRHINSASHRRNFAFMT